MSRAKALALILWISFALSVVYQKALGPRLLMKQLRIPLSELPMEVFGPDWKGEDLPLPAKTVRIARVSDYLNRNYNDGRRSFWFYVGFVAGWDPGGIHNPLGCFPNIGFKLEADEVVVIPWTAFPSKVVFNESRWWKEGQDERMYTLTTFYYKGRFEPSEWELRAERVFGVPYFAIINLSGKLESSLEETRATFFELVQRVAPLLLKHFPEGEPAPALNTLPSSR